VQESSKNYEGFLFKEALRTCFFEFQAARDKYRELCLLNGMHKDLVMRFIATQVLILSPICPHISEYVWTKLLGNHQSIMKARWPQTSSVDETLLKCSEYLRDASHDFRVRLKAFLALASKGKGKNAPAVAAPKLVEATIWVAKTYPQWQSIILSTMASLFKEHNGLPDNKVLSSELGGKSELKKYMKKVMPFVQMMREKVDKIGVKALQLTVDFNEIDILTENMPYLMSTLDVTALTIEYNDKADEKIKEECCPGAPFIVFVESKYVSLTCVNPQGHTGLFEVSVPVISGDDCKKLVSRIVKESRQLKETSKIKLYRYENPNDGPRKIPVLGKILDDKVEIKENCLFEVNVVKKELAILDGDKRFELGDQIIYCVE